MRYVSTRGQAPVRDFAGVLLAGLAEDGGLYVPEAWPRLDVESLRGLPYAELAARVIEPFLGGWLPPGRLLALCRDAYANFGHPAIAPLVQLDSELWALELFHGPTLAFKDVAMQLLGRFFDEALVREGRRVTIVGATSGDTGSAAIEACRDRASVNVVILHPEGRTSEVQRRQMTTVLSPNVGNLAVAGTFDDCQDLVKAMFADAPFRDDMRLAAVNSINWARIAAQIPYYVAASLTLGGRERPVDFAVPTGNLGKVLAAWAAGRLGARVGRLVVASNRNDILARFLAANDMTMRSVEPSLAPSMDIQVSSNFERLLFELLDRDAERTVATVQAFREGGRMAVPEVAWRRATAEFTGFALDDPGTSAEMRRLWAQGYLADPHTAIGTAAGRAHARSGTPLVVAATAHPAKFPDAVEAATGVRPSLPTRLADLYDRLERFTAVPARLDLVEAQVRAFTHRNAA